MAFSASSINSLCSDKRDLTTGVILFILFGGIFIFKIFIFLIFNSFMKLFSFSDTNNTLFPSDLYRAVLPLWEHFQCAALPLLCRYRILPNMAQQVRL